MRLHFTLGLIIIFAMAGCPRHSGDRADGGIDAGQQVTCDNNGGCDPNATCSQREASRLCICYPWYVGDGLTCSKTGLQVGSPWPIIGGNVRHTGQSAYVGPQTSHLKWSVPIGQYGLVFSLVLDASGNIYAGTTGNFQALDAHGNFLWGLPIDLASWSSPALAADSTLFVQGGHSQPLLYAFDTALKPQTNRVKWFFNTQDARLNSPSIGADGTVYVPACPDVVGETSVVYAFGPGAESTDAGYTWSMPNSTGCYNAADPAIGSDGTIYITDFNALQAVGPQGTLKWSTPISGSYAGTNKPVIAPDGTIYMGSHDGILYAIDPATGVSKSRRIMGDSVYSLALGADGTLYVGGSEKDKQLVALTPSTFWDSGAVNWRISTRDEVDFIVLGADGTLYLSSYQLYAYNSDGSLKWSTTSLNAYLSEPAIAKDGTLYVVDSSAALYAFGP